MSHFTKLKVTFTDHYMINKVASEMGLIVRKVPEFVNKYSKETIKNATVLYTKSMKPVLAITDNGEAVVDDYYMGTTWKEFAQRYAVEKIKETAFLYGYEYEVKNEGEDTVVEIIME